MQVLPVNTITTRTSFKSSIPVFIHVGESIEKALPVAKAEKTKGHMQMLLLYLNNSLKRGKDIKRDDYIDKLREFFKRYLPDFGGKVRAFTCVDGGKDENIVRPPFYLATGNTLNSLVDLEKELVDTIKFSEGYKIAEIPNIKKKYYRKGKNIVENASKSTKNNKNEQVAMHVYFNDILTKSGKFKEHKLLTVRMLPCDEKDPHIKLEK